MGTARRQYTDEFKQEALGLLASSGRPLDQIASELGVPAARLRDWRNRSAGSQAVSPRRPNMQAMFRDYEWQVTLLASLYICGSSILRFRVSKADGVTASPFSNILLRSKTPRHCTAKFKRHPLAHHR
jgi:hypothetical protein